MIISVDFDGTIVQHEYPKIGKPIPFAIETLKDLQAEGHRLILWTFRHGRTLEAAVRYCEQQGLSFYAVNANEPGEEYSESMPRLVKADVYIDDRNLGGLYDWQEVKTLLKKH
jgi:hypothetical protein